MDHSINSVSFLRPHWLCWKVLGITRNKIQPKYRNYYVLYAIFINLIVTFGNPFHLSMAMFRSPTLAENIQNLEIAVTCVACSSKFIIYAWKFKQIYEIERLLHELDKRVLSSKERQHFKIVAKQLRNIVFIFLIIYLPVGLTGEIAFFLSKERKLLYIGWFPFDWKSSAMRYYGTNIFQVTGLFYQLIQNYVDDCFPTIILCLISGHVQMLCIRVSNIGYDNEKTQMDNEMELQRCIRDQNNLYDLFDTLQALMSWPMFIQFALTAFNMCVAMAALIFFVDGLWDRVYTFVYFVAMPTQIFPACYYGTQLEVFFGRLHYAVFESNWMDQSPKYKKHMVLFAERSLKQTTALAGGMIRVHVDTFFATCKGAYSLFCVILRLK